MRLVTVVFLAVASATSAPAGELKKPYFAASRPGSWARYEMTAEGVGKSTYTYTRLPDRDGREQLEIKIAFTEGTGAGTTSTSRYVFKKGFHLATDSIGYSQAVDEFQFVGEDGVATPLPADTVKAIREGASDYRNGFTFKSAGEAEGRRCDWYVYRAPSGGAAPTVDDGEMCLDPDVPFGIVKQAGKLKDEAGTVRSTYTIRLLASSQGRLETDAAATATTGVEAGDAAVEAAAAGKAGAPRPLAAPLTLESAYQSEKVRLAVEVVAGSGGKRLMVTLVNKTEVPLQVVLSRGKVTIAAGSMLETLTLVSDAARTVDLPASDSAGPFELGQAGKRGAVEGKFTLSVYEGEALFQGSVTSGNLEN